MKAVKWDFQESRMADGTDWIGLDWIGLVVTTTISCARATFHFLEGCLNLVLLSSPLELLLSFRILSLPFAPFDVRLTQVTSSAPSVFPLECIGQSSASCMRASSQQE